MVLITYDVNTSTEAGKRRLRAVAKQCQNYGQRVQYSVFECLVDSVQMKQLKQRFLKLIDPEQDSLRLYYMGNDWRNRIEHIGTKVSIDLEGTLIA